MIYNHVLKVTVGAYARVVRGGTMRRGDPVRLE
jgi:MOSC domain-containing protein YiiM